MKLLNDWLVINCNKYSTDRITQREVLQLGPNPTRDRDRRDRALNTLVDAGRILLEKSGKSDIVIVNPELIAGISP